LSLWALSKWTKIAMLQRFIFALFSGRPSLGPNRESLGGERGGEPRAVPRLLPSGSTLRASPPRARCRFLLKDRPSEEQSSRIPRGKEKVRFLRAGSLAPLAAGGQRRESGIALRPQSRERSHLSLPERAPGDRPRLSHYIAEVAQRDPRTGNT